MMARSSQKLVAFHFASGFGNAAKLVFLLFTIGSAMQLAQQSLAVKRQRMREVNRLALVAKSQTTFSTHVAVHIISKPLLADPLFVDHLRRGWRSEVFERGRRRRYGLANI